MFFLGFIASIYINQQDEPKQVKKMVYELEKSTTKKNVSRKIADASEAKEKIVISINTRLKNNTKDSAIEKTADTAENEIGEGLTLSDIENADVSEEEKKAMLDDLVYNQSLNMEESLSLSEEDLLKIIEEDLKNN